MYALLFDFKNRENIHIIHTLQIEINQFNSLSKYNHMIVDIKVKVCKNAILEKWKIAIAPIFFEE